ncbi:uncharacterized protein LOC128238206 [Mya arenaria]|uniref:uncharacterized protein LOC128238206 n=1 Tax=Mya arenaria TaxID=6604 RepID=UPI0022E4B926|nr:uncharacterized protein LOC128238206 [Mya arenaria]
MNKTSSKFKILIMNFGDNGQRKQKSTAEQRQLRNDFKLNTIGAECKNMMPWENNKDGEVEEYLQSEQITITVAPGLEHSRVLPLFPVETRTEEQQRHIHMQATEEFHVRNEQTISIASNRGSLQIRSTADQTLPSPVLPSLVSPVNVRSMTGHLDQARQYTGPETDSFIDIYIQPSRAEGIQESQHLNSEFDEIGEHDERSNSINENNTLLNIPTPNRKEILRRELGATAENSTNDLAGGVNNLHITNPDIKRSIEEQRRICTVDMGFSNEMFSFAVNELRQQGYQRPSIEAIVATIETIHNRSQHDTDIRSNGNRKKTSQEPTPLQNRIKNKAYNTYNLRLTSFAKWPEHIAQRPPKLAEAGLYYTGKDDHVRCFACDGGLRQWDPEDDP